MTLSPADQMNTTKDQLLKPFSIQHQLGWVTSYPPFRLVNTGITQAEAIHRVDRIVILRQLILLRLIMMVILAAVVK